MSLTKPTLSNLRAAGTTVGDVYFPQTTLLLPFNGANGATTTSDLSNNNVPVTFVGTSQISTAQSKFGGSSMLFDGNSDYLTVNHSSFGSFATSTFTIEFWVYFNSTSGFQRLVNNYSGSSGGLSLSKSSSHVLTTNLSGDGVDITGTTTVSTGQWYHVALSGSSGSYKLFLDGVQEGSTYTGSTASGSSTYQVGAFYWSGSFYYGIDGYLDDVRFTAGIARYTSAFTPPTTAHLTSAGDVNKQIIVNSAADGVAIGTGGINQARIAKAWCKFTGTGTAAIDESYNVSSITDRGTGQYSVTFSTAMSNSDYSFTATTGGGVDSWVGLSVRGSTFSTTVATFTISYAYTSSNGGGSVSVGYSDGADVSVIVFGN